MSTAHGPLRSGIGTSGIGPSRQLLGPIAQAKTQPFKSNMTKKRRKAPRLPIERDARGRIHLIIRRDAAGAPEGLELSAPLFAEQWQNTLALSAASTAYGLLGGAPTWANVVALTHKALSAASQVGKNALAQSNQAAPACREGCSHCCHHTVGVSPPEVFAIVDHIDTHFTESQRAALKSRLISFTEQTRGLSPTERFSPEHGCPLLVESHCSVYPARPLTCRGANSLSEKACEDSLHDEHKRAQYIAGDYVIPRYLEPIRAAHSIAAGVQLALSDLHDLDMTPIELTCGLSLLLSEPEEVAKRWLRGEPVFAAARIALDEESAPLRLFSGKR